VDVSVGAGDGAPQADLAVEAARRRHHLMMTRGMRMRMIMMMISVFHFLCLIGRGVSAPRLLHQVFHLLCLVAGGVCLVAAQGDGALAHQAHDA
jgi:hypothetical protein